MTFQKELRPNEFPSSCLSRHRDQPQRSQLSTTTTSPLVRCLRVALRATALLSIVTHFLLPTVCHADLVLGSGTEATWLYNPSDGNLEFRIESGEEYNGLILSTTLDHIDASAPDFSTRFLLSSHPGFTAPFTGVSEKEMVFLYFVGASDPCPECLTGTVDFGKIMVTGLTTTEIIDNWSTMSSVRPMGGADSTMDPTAFGIIAVPEPSPILLGCFVSVACGLVTFCRRIVRNRNKD